MGPTELTVYRPLLTLRLKWLSQQAAQYSWRWQAALWPFPSDPALAPETLLAEGRVVGDVFSVDLGTFPPLGEAPTTSAQTSGAPAGTAVATPVPGALPTAARAAPGGARGGSTAARALPAPLGTQPPTASVPPVVDASRTPALAAQAGTAPAAAAMPVPNGPALDAALDVYVRILPFEDGALAAPPSNFVVAHYLPGNDPFQQQIDDQWAAISAQKDKLAEMTAVANVFTLELVSFENAILEDPNRWGCVVVATNPYDGKLAHPLAGYEPGGTYCPKVDPSKQQKDWDEQVLEGVEGFGHAWNGLSWAFEQAKNWVATKFAETVPCEWLGDDLQDDCESAAKSVASTAISVGLAAAGVPPSLPDLDAMGALAKGKAVEAAVEYSCSLIESEGGECTPEMRDALAKIYTEGLNELQKSAHQQMHEPACGDVQGAKERGLLPLPCFSAFPGATVTAAPGAVETPPAVSVRVTRTKPDPSFPMNCKVSTALTLHNEIEGHGPVTGQLWTPVTEPLPPIGTGQSAIVKLVYGPRQPFQIYAKNGDIEWYHLLLGAKGTFGVGTMTAQAVAPGDAGPVALNCSNTLQRTVQVPKSISVDTKWTLQ
jgi:hypothetical protein